MLRYAGLATQLWGEQIPMNGPLLDYTLKEPVGVCAQIVPWNFPLLMLAWKIAPALAERFQLVLPDLRGYGGSSVPDSDPGRCNRT